MVKEIRIYVEGGGDGKKTKAAVRRGFNEFFKCVKIQVEEKGIRWDIIACGSRNATLNAFKTALQSQKDAFNILLVDAEAPVKTTTTPRAHLKNRDKWSLPKIPEDHFHLMVQVMESWLIADVDTLQSFYKQGFNSNAIPKETNVEKIEKKKVASALDNATRKTQKGKYHKIQHGPELLKIIDVNKVREAAYYCDRLFKTLEEKITS